MTDNKTKKTKQTITPNENAQAIFAEWVERLNLGGWALELDLQSGDVEDGNHAEINIPYDYNCAKITLAEGWEEWDQYKLNEVMAHELTHCHLHHMQVAALSCKEYMGQEARNLYYKRYTHELEKATDIISLAFLDSLGTV